MPTRHRGSHGGIVGPGVVTETGGRPQGFERSVTGGGDNGLGAEEAGHLGGEDVPAVVAAEDGDGIVAGVVDADERGVGVLVAEVGRDQADGGAHRHESDHGVALDEGGGEGGGGRPVDEMRPFQERCEARRRRPAPFGRRHQRDHARCPHTRNTGFCGTRRDAPARSAPRHAWRRVTSTK